jgi:hypothetical protein
MRVADYDRFFGILPVARQRRGLIAHHVALEEAAWIMRPTPTVATLPNVVVSKLRPVDARWSMLWCSAIRKWSPL